MAANKWLRETFKLTPLEESFCYHYIATRCNATEAYSRASPNEIKRATARDKGCRLLKRADIRARVNELLRNYLAELNLSASDVVQELSRVAVTTLLDVASWNEAGQVTVLPSGQMGARQASALRTIKSTTRSIPRKDELPITETKLEVTMCDKIKALELLGKYFNMFAEKKVEGEKDLDVKLKKARERAEKKKKLADVVKLVQPGTEAKV